MKPKTASRGATAARPALDPPDRPDLGAARVVLPHLPVDPRNWKAILQALINENNWRHGAKVKGVSHKTAHERALFLFGFFNTLRERGRYIDPRTLGNRHIQLVVDVWVKRKLVAATLQTYFSFLRAFSRWIGKPALIMPINCYISDPELYRRSGVALADKSWTSKGILSTEIIAAIAEEDPNVGAQLHSEAAFALRVKEALMLRPRGCILTAEQVPGGFRSADHFERAQYYLHIGPGSKGGRDRYLPIDTPERWAAVKRVLLLTRSESAHLGRPSDTLQQTKDRFYYVMKKYGVTRKNLGVTAHGLRHQWANDAFERLAQETAPLRGGPAIDPELDAMVRRAIASELGHARPRISAAYLGTPHKAPSSR